MTEKRVSLTAEERADRDVKVFQLFVAGRTFREIAAFVGLKSVASVDAIIKKELKSAAARRGLLCDEAFAVWQERTEKLFSMYWSAAMKGDVRAAEICRRIIQQQSGLYGIDQTPAARPVAVERDDDEELDELASLRARRSPA